MDATLLRTPLFERHVALGARMVPFAGYEMPVQYEGVIPEHKAVRLDAGAFDVSHMGEIHVDGPTAQEFLQSMLSNDVDKLEDGEAQYTLLTNDTGGIVDDLIAYRLAHGQFYLVVNASNRAAVYDWLKEREPRGCEVRDASDEYGLVAVQGRARSSGSASRTHRPSRTRWASSTAIEVMVARTGYTGEQGVELCCAEDDAVELWDAILARGRHPVRPRRARHAPPRGLLPAARQRHHARDGRDLGRSRLGVRARHRVHRASRRSGASRRKVRRADSCRSSWKSVPSRGRACRSTGGGEVTSGTHSPMLDVGIGMGYVPTASATPDSELVIDVRGKPRRARIVKKPIYRKET